MIKIIPAVDVKNGKCVRLIQGKADQETIYSDDPVAMATAMRHAVIAGRTAYLAGRMPSREIAVPSSPTQGMLD